MSFAAKKGRFCTDTVVSGDGHGFWIFGGQEPGRFLRRLLDLSAQLWYNTHIWLIYPWGLGTTPLFLEE